MLVVKWVSGRFQIKQALYSSEVLFKGGRYEEHSTKKIKPPLLSRERNSYLILNFVNLILTCPRKVLLCVKVTKKSTKSCYCFCRFDVLIADAL